ncbi:hypothetical protein P879_11499 [Paragonimus westermani]|uniref:Uncharacterized protein n=1 Tax=Paragonimus westermani TaxID=34504 RepID=A0A8T0DCK7_9TREM|nr:hypothetical protein P879_11499 [Paragonimus westermani]
MFGIWSVGLTECPDELIHIGDGICVIKFTNTSHYCDAHRTCEREGSAHKLRLFMIGRNVGKLPNSTLENVTVHVGIHSLLGDRQGHQSEWQVSEPGYISNSLGKESNALVSRPPDHEQLIVMKHGTTKAVSSNEVSAMVICEKSEKEHHSKIGSSKFSKNHPWPLTSIFMESDNPVGCFRHLSATTALACGLK